MARLLLPWEADLGGLGVVVGADVACSVPPAPAFWAGTAPSVTVGHRPALAARRFDAVEARLLSRLPVAAVALSLLKGICVKKKTHGHDDFFVKRNGSGAY